MGRFVRLRGEVVKQSSATPVRSHPVRVRFDIVVRRLAIVGSILFTLVLLFHSTAANDAAPSPSAALMTMASGERSDSKDLTEPSPADFTPTDAEIRTLLVGCGDTGASMPVRVLALAATSVADPVSWNKIIPPVQQNASAPTLSLFRLHVMRV